MTPKPDQGGEKLTAPEITLDDVESFLAERLLIAEEGKGHWAACIQFIDAWKSRAVKEALEKADSEIYEAMTSKPGETSFSEWERGMQYARGILRQLAQEVGGE